MASIRRKPRRRNHRNPTHPREAPRRREPRNCVNARNRCRALAILTAHAGCCKAAALSAASPARHTLYRSIAPRMQRPDAFLELPQPPGVAGKFEVRTTLAEFTPVGAGCSVRPISRILIPFDLTEPFNRVWIKAEVILIPRDGKRRRVLGRIPRRTYRKKHANAFDFRQPFWDMLHFRRPIVLPIKNRLHVALFLQVITTFRLNEVWLSERVVVSPYTLQCPLNGAVIRRLVWRSFKQTSVRSRLRKFFKRDLASRFKTQ